MGTYTLLHISKTYKLDKCKAVRLRLKIVILKQFKEKMCMHRHVVVQHALVTIQTYMHMMQALLKILFKFTKLHANVSV